MEITIFCSLCRLCKLLSS